MRIFTLLSFTLLLCLGTTSAQTFKWNNKSAAPVKTPAAAPVNQGPQTGLATFYADYLDGQTTAYGETYRRDQYTASHPTLALGTILTVTRQSTGKQVNVRVNDRAPLCQGCVVALSYAAARSLDLIVAGKAQVTIQPIGFSNWNPQPVAGTPRPDLVSRGEAAPARYSEVNAASRRTAYEPAYTPAAAPQTYGTAQPVVTPSAYGSGTAPVGSVLPQGAYNSRTSASGPGTPVGPTANNAPVYNPAAASATPAPYGTNPADLRPAASTTPAYQPQVPPAVTYDRYPAAPTAAPETYGSTPARPTVGNQSSMVPRAGVPAQITRADAARIDEVQVIANGDIQGYGVQLGAYGDQRNAHRQVVDLQQRGLDNVFIKEEFKADGGKLNRVIIGPYSTIADAQEEMRRLTSGFGTRGMVLRL